MNASIAKLQTFVRNFKASGSFELLAHSRVGWPVLGLIALIAAAGFYLLGDIAADQDKTYAQNTRGFVQQSINSLSQSNAKIATEYSTWDDAYINITLAPNPDWIRSNFYSTNTSSVAVVRPGEGLKFIYVGPDFEQRRAVLSRFVEGLDLVVREKARGFTSPTYVSSYPNSLVNIDGQLATMTVHPLRPEPGSAVKLRDQRLPIDYVVVITYVDAGFIEGIARSFALDDMSFTLTSVKPQLDTNTVGFMIKDEAGRPLAWFQWRNLKPGTTAFSNRIIPISIILALVGLLTMLVTQEIVSGQMRLVEKARLAAEEGSRAKSSFLANVSHELRTPLNAIIGFAEIIDEDCTNAGNNITARDAKKVSSSAQHLLGLINDLLDHSKIEAGKMDMNPALTQLGPLVASVAEALESNVAKNGSTLVVRCDPLIGDACLDGMRLKQCLLNLVSNAAKFTKDGTVTLSVRPLDRDGVPFIRLMVKDTGIGMSEDVLAKLFAPFVQASEATATTYGGTGLGLVITRRLCEAMGGYVDVESVEGEGSTFTMFVPRGMAWTSAGDQSNGAVAA